jgi:hypothetical protein
MKTTIEGSAVLHDGKHAGDLTIEGDFKPIEGLHHATAKRIAKDIDILKQGGQVASRLPHKQENIGSNPIPATTPKAGKDLEPEMDPDKGDKTPAYVEWFKRNHSKAEFEAKYGNRRFEGADQ